MHGSDQRVFTTTQLFQATCTMDIFVYWIVLDLDLDLHMCVHAGADPCRI